jgi:hypothetical protein
MLWNYFLSNFEGSRANPCPPSCNSQASTRAKVSTWYFDTTRNRITLIPSKIRASKHFRATPQRKGAGSTQVARARQAIHASLDSSKRCRADAARRRALQASEHAANERTVSGVQVISHEADDSERRPRCGSLPRHRTSARSNADARELRRSLSYSR